MNTPGRRTFSPLKLLFPAALVGLLALHHSNLALPAGRRLRVLLIEPRVDWSKIKSKGDISETAFDRESHMAGVLEREVYATGRKALFFTGGARLGWAGGPLQELERKHPGTTLNIAIHEGFADRTDELEARLVAGPKTTLALLRGTWWGGNLNWPSHPYNAANNINGIDGDPNGDHSGYEIFSAQSAAPPMQFDIVEREAQWEDRCAMLVLPENSWVGQALASRLQAFIAGGGVEFLVPHVSIYEVLSLEGS